MNKRRASARWPSFPVACAISVAVAAAALDTACAQGAGKGAGGLPAKGAATAPSALFDVPTSEKAVALTYDDGPAPGTVGTAGILALLEAQHAKATFFVIGEEVHRRPAILAAAAKAGMEIENHGERHANMAHLGEGPLRRVIAQGARTIAAVTKRRPIFLRPPFGSQSARVRRVAHALGERVVIWSVDTRDWTNPGSATIVARVLRQVRPGAIVLMHDGGANRSQTVTATRELLVSLKARGYRMVTLEDLLRIGQKAPPARPAAPALATPAGSR